MKKFALLLMMCAGLFTGCSDDNEATMNAYAFGITSISGTFDDMAKVENYLTSKDCVMSPQIITGKNFADTDKKAKDIFDLSKAKISVSELAALGLSSGMSFSYTASRYEDPTDPESDTLYIGTFSYTQ